MRATTVALLALVATNAGCNRILGIGDTTLANDDAGGISDGGADAMPDAMDPTLITGRVLHRYLFEGTTTDAPDDLSGVQIQAFQENQPQGTFTSLPGTGDADGTFQIPNAPQETLWIRVGTRYYQTDLRHLELVTGEVRRPQIALATQNTPLALNLSDMTPWQQNDQIEINSPAGVWITPLDVPGGTAPMPGVTTYSLEHDYRDYASFVGGELPMLQGEQFFITQLVQQTDSTGLDYNALERVATPTPITQTDGQRSEVNAALTVAARMEDVSIDWRGADFAAETADMCPGTPLFEGYSLSVFSVPYGLDHGFTSLSTPLLVNATLPSTNEVHDFHYRNPFPADWGTVVSGFHYCGLQGTFGYEIAIHTQISPAADVSGAFQPRIGPPTAVQVNGNDASAEVLISEGTPEVTWTAPAQGSPDIYILSIDDVSEGSRARVASLYAHTTRVRVPPDIMLPGRAYAFRIAAAINMDPLVAGNSPYDNAYTQAVTGSIIVDHPPVIQVNASNGDDTNSGTVNAPFKTITHALSVATVGNTINVDPGTYDASNGETFPLVVPTGVTLQNTGGLPDNTIIRGGVASADPSVTVEVQQQANLSGFTVENDQASSGTTIGVRITGSTAEVRNNIITGVITGGTSDGIVVETGGQQILADNDIKNHNGGGIVFNSASNPRVENNRVTANQVGVRFASIIGADLGGGSAGSTGGNQIYCNTTADISYEDGVNGIDAQNNQWDHSPPTTATGSPTGGIDIDYAQASQDGTINAANSSLVASPCP